MIKNFVPDFMSKNLQDYEKCWKNREFEALKTNEEKDRMFLECHKKWIRNLKENVQVESNDLGREVNQTELGREINGTE